MMNRILKLIVLVFLLCPALAAAEEYAVAMITDMNGISRNVVNTPPKQLDIFSELFADDQLKVEKDASLTLIYWDDYKVFHVRGPSVVHILNDSLEYVSGHKPEMKKMPLQHKVRINPAEVVQSGLVMRSVKKTKPISLLNLRGVKTSETRPVFLWKLHQQTDRVRFELVDEDGNMLLVKVLNGEHFKLPASVHLKEAMTYSWSVEGRMENGQVFADWGDFELASPSLMAQKNSLKLGSDAGFSDRLLYAAWLQENGFGDDAHRLWLKLAGERPNSAALKEVLAR
jgi:hypothetical protein